MDPNVPGWVHNDQVEIQVPNKYIARLIQRGVHAERADRQRSARRKAEKLARRRNRKR